MRPVPSDVERAVHAVRLLMAYPYDEVMRLSQLNAPQFDRLVKIGRETMCQPERPLRLLVSAERHIGHNHRVEEFMARDHSGAERANVLARKRRRYRLLNRVKWQAERHDWLAWTPEDQFREFGR